MKTSMHQNTLRSTLVAGLATLGMLLGAAADGSAQAKAPETLKLFVGRSHRITTSWDVAGVSLTDPTIADVQVLTPRMVMLSGKAVGTTDVIMWSDAGDSTELRLEVEIDLDRLRGELGKMFPGSTLDVQMSEGVLIVEGSMAQAEQADQLHRYLEQRNLPFMDRSMLPGIQQVQAKIRFAEVSRTGLRKLGVAMFDGNSDSNFGTLIGGTSTVTASDTGTIFENILTPDLGANTQSPERHDLRELHQVRLPHLRGRPGGQQIPPPARGADPRRIERRGGQLPGRRRVPHSRRAGRRRWRQHLDLGRVQAVRRGARLPADRAR
jgi:Flp pilus assembly secretin CpaC